MGEENTGAGRLDIGLDHFITFAEYQGEPAGIDVHHKTPSGETCVGWVAFRGSAWEKGFINPTIEAWDVKSLEPLTLEPSILCRACGDHGYIRNGRWEPA